MFLYIYFYRVSMVFDGLGGFTCLCFAVVGKDR